MSQCSRPTSSFIRDLLNDLHDAVWSLRREKDELFVAVREGQAMARDVDTARRELAALKKHVVETNAKLVLLKEQNRRLEKDRCMLFFVLLAICGLFVMVWVMN
uniref:Coiled-coil domain-containing protein 167 n=1 Tax=Oryza glaberrima TaxID=4538 RepID=I1Q7D2_ORYGL